MHRFLRVLNANLFIQCSPTPIFLFGDGDRLCLNEKSVQTRFWILACPGLLPADLRARLTSFKGDNPEVSPKNGQLLLFWKTRSGQGFKKNLSALKVYA